MNLDYVRSTIEPMLLSWGEIPVFFENVSSKSKDGLSEYLQYRELIGDTILRSVGGASRRPHSDFTGVLRFYIHVPQNEGTQRKNDLMQSLSDLFEYKRLGVDGKLVTYDSEPSDFSNQDGYYQGYLDIGYSRRHQAA